MARKYNKKFKLENNNSGPGYELYENDIYHVRKQYIIYTNENLYHYNKPKKNKKKKKESLYQHFIKCLTKIKEKFYNLFNKKIDFKLFTR